MNADHLSLKQQLLNLKNDPEFVPSETFRKNSKIRLDNVLSGTHRHVQVRRYQNRILAYSLRFSFLSLMLAAGTVYAVQFSKPTDPLFQMKILSERIALQLSPTEKSKTAVAGSIIARRARELENAERDGDKEEIQRTKTNFTSTVIEIRNTEHISKEEIEQEISEYSSLFNFDGNAETEQSGDDSTFVESRVNVQGAQTRQTETPPTIPTEAAETNTEKPERGTQSPTVTPIIRISVRTEEIRTETPVSEETDHF